MLELFGKALIRDGELIGSFTSEELNEFLINEINELQEELTVKKWDASSAESQLSKVEDDLDDCQRDYTYLESERDKLLDEIDALKEEVDYLKEELMAERSY